MTARGCASRPKQRGTVTNQGAKILHRDIKSNNLAFTADFSSLKLFGKCKADGRLKKNIVTLVLEILARGGVLSASSAPFLSPHHLLWWSSPCQPGSLFLFAPPVFPTIILLRRFLGMAHLSPNHRGITHGPSGRTPAPLSPVSALCSGPIRPLDQTSASPRF